MASLVEDLDVAASWISQALQASGYVADFSPASLWSIDRFMDEHTTSGKPRPGGLLATDFGARMFALGAYTGESSGETSAARGGPTMKIPREKSTSNWSYPAEA